MKRNVKNVWKWNYVPSHSLASYLSLHEIVCLKNSSSFHRVYVQTMIEYKVKTHRFNLFQLTALPQTLVQHVRKIKVVGRYEKTRTENLLVSKGVKGVQQLRDISCSFFGSEIALHVFPATLLSLTVSTSYSPNEFTYVNGLFPKNLTSLFILVDTQCDFPPFPPNLTNLQLLTHAGKLPELPQSLLTLNAMCIRQPLPPLPQGLKLLNLGTYSHKISSLPPTLQTLILDNYKCPLPSLPSSLEVLHLGRYEHFQTLFAMLPSSLTDLMLGAFRHEFLLTFNYIVPLPGKGWVLFWDKGIGISATRAKVL